MTNSILSTYLHPSNIMLIDDSKTFLQNMEKNLKQKHFVSHEVNLEKAKKKIEKNQSHYIESFYTCMFSKEDPMPDPETDDEFFSTLGSLNYEIKNIHHLINNPRRFDVISVVVVDYSMPQMTGVEFCKQLSHLPIKKIMLTGEADHKVAVEAFNSNTIDAFLLKGSENMYDDLTQKIQQLQHQYFNQVSQSMISNVQHRLQKLAIYPEFEALFFNMIKKYNIVEYYLIDALGSSLLLNQQGKAFWLRLYHDEQLAMYSDIAKTSFLDATIIDTIESYKAAPFLINAEDEELSPERWGAYLHPVQTFQANTSYYYAVITDDQQHILSDLVPLQDYKPAKN